MAVQELLMPKMGESIMEATILVWLKKPGDAVEQDESVLEVATDKVDTEIPSTHAGKLTKILAKEGAVVQVGTPIALIEWEGTSDTASVEPAHEPAVQAKPRQPAAPSVETTHVKQEAPIKNTDRFYSPLVRNIAHRENISPTELETILGSGLEGRVTKKDILMYVRTRGTTKPIPQPQVATHSVSTSPEDEIIEMDRMRQMIAARMLDSKRTSPHVTSFVEADVTSLVNWRNQIKDAYKEREGEPLTLTPLLVEAVAKAILDFPMVNIQVNGNKIIKKKDINIGMAVALPSGNLIVPVIRNADQMDLKELAKKVYDLTTRARDNKLVPDELTGGTFTVSNVGSFGNVMGTPIIVQPQVGIIAFGAVQKKPAVIETPNGDAIAIRNKMFLSHSYDHRVVDGALGGSMVKKVADYLTTFDVTRQV